MANKFGEAALIAARLEVPASVSALERWDTAVRQLYPEKPYMQKKTAPRAAFLGLCEAGLVSGVPTGVSPTAAPAAQAAQAAQAAAGHLTSVNPNKRYALRAVELLRQGGRPSFTALWSHATESDPESDPDATPHNAQMDVVLALWRNGLIAVT